MKKWSDINLDLSNCDNYIEAINKIIKMYDIRKENLNDFYEFLFHTPFSKLHWFDCLSEIALKEQERMILNLESNDKVNLGFEPYRIEDRLSVSKYMCILPKTTCILSTIPKLSVCNTCEVISEYLDNKLLVDENITSLFPYYYDRDDDHSPYGYDYTDKLIRINNGISGLKPYPYSNLNGNIVDYSNMRSIYISFPWLYDADVNNYLSIVKKNPDEFEHLASRITMLSLKCNSYEELVKELKYEIDEALINIKINCEKKQDILKRKGIRTVMGVALTILPIAFPDKIPTEFSTLFGGASFFSATDLVNDFISQKKMCNENPFWVIWKWKNSIK